MNNFLRKNKIALLIIMIATLPLIFSVYAILARQNAIFLIIYCVLGLITFIAYALDKQRAIEQQWRIPEFTLHLLELSGGWAGGLLAQHYLRHKNRKLLYQLIFWPIVGIHVVGWVFYISH